MHFWLRVLATFTDCITVAAQAQRTVKRPLRAVVVVPPGVPVL